MEGAEITKLLEVVILVVIAPFITIIANQIRKWLNAKASAEPGWVAPALLAVDFARLRRSRQRLVERVPRGRGRSKALELHTTLVPLPGLESASRFLLIYSYRLGARAPFRLVTVFPVEPGAVEALWSQPLGERTEVLVRYNAAPPGMLRGEAMLGSRSRWVASEDGWQPG